MAQKSMKNSQNSPPAISGSTVTLWSYENTFYEQKTKQKQFNSSSPLRQRSGILENIRSRLHTGCAVFVQIKV